MHKISKYEKSIKKQRRNIYKYTKQTHTIYSKQLYKQPLKTADYRTFHESRYIKWED